MFFRSTIHEFILRTLLCLAAAGLPGALAAVEGAPKNALWAIKELPPGEQYRQLSLLLLLADGADEGLLGYLGGEEEATLESLPDQAHALQQYPTPLARIADPDSMLRGAGEMMRFAHENRTTIEQELAAIAESWPILVSMIDMNAVREDAIIIRSAVADSLQYQQGQDLGELPADSLLAYQGETLRQRNHMEYLLFQNDLDNITDAAIDDLSYKLDAYQRMTDEDMNPELLQERIDASENMNEEARERFREQAYIRASTLYLMLIPALVTVATD
jgi:hypothetical protein